MYSMVIIVTFDLSSRFFDWWFRWSGVWLGCRILNLRLGRRYFWVWQLGRHRCNLRRGCYVLNLWLWPVQTSQHVFGSGREHILAMLQTLDRQFVQEPVHLFRRHVSRN